MPDELTNLEQLLDRIGEAGEDQERVSVAMIVAAVGRRSFGALLVVAGIILVSPLSGIPGMPTTMGLLVLLISGQLLFRRKHFWLPRWLLTRSLRRKRVGKALELLRPPARFIDRFLRPRLTLLIHGVSVYGIAGICLVIALGLPVMELVPFSATGAGAALTAFGLSLTAHDGALALLAFGFTVVTSVLVIFAVL